MEDRFGHDFSGVRVHTDAQAAESSLAVEALAYTVGNNVVFGANQYAPNTNHGKQLLAHELTHVIQQTNGNASHGNDIAENEAEMVADNVVSGKPTTVRINTGLTLQRSEPTEEELKKQRETGSAQCMSNRCHSSTSQMKDLRSFNSSDNAELRGWLSSQTPTEQSPSNEHKSPKKSDPKKFKELTPEEKALMIQMIKDEPVREAAEKTRKEEEIRKAITISHSTGAIYQDPYLDRPAAERKLRENHTRMKMLFPEMSDALESDPSYWKAMGIYNENDLATSTAIPKATPGVLPPKPLLNTGIVIDNPDYWKTPRGQASLKLKSEISATRNALEALYGERKDIVDSSILIRKTSEAVVGVEPPPIAKLNQCRSLLHEADDALKKDDVESAAKSYGEASRLQREASWYWSRYKEFMFLGAERVKEGLETVRDASKHSLMVLSMAATGGASTPLWIGVGGSIAIDLTSAGTRQALGEKVDWTKVTVDAAVQIILARFGGRFTQGLIGKLAKLPKFSGFDKSILGGAISGVLNGMESRLVTSAVDSKFKGETWGKTLENLVNGLADWGIFLDLMLGAVHAKLNKRPKITDLPDLSESPVLQGSKVGNTNDVSPPATPITAAKGSRGLPEGLDKIAPGTRPLGRLSDRHADTNKPPSEPLSQPVPKVVELQEPVVVGQTHGSGQKPSHLSVVQNEPVVDAATKKGTTPPSPSISGVSKNTNIPPKAAVGNTPKASTSTKPRGTNKFIAGSMTEAQFKESMKTEPGHYPYVISDANGTLIKRGIASDPIHEFNGYVTDPRPARGRMPYVQMHVYSPKAKYQALSAETAGNKMEIREGRESLNQRIDTREEMHGGAEWNDALEPGRVPEGTPLITISRF
jgi:Domain of unknown function (DUF4157)